jgi:ABC-2 type transport system ATP-binding protein
VHADATSRQSTLLVRLGGPVLDPAYHVSEVGLEDLVLGYLGAAAPGYAHLALAGGDR